MNHLTLDGYAATTFSNASSSQVAFAFRVTPELALPTPHHASSERRLMPLELRPI
jgi:hypothetical protein